MTMTYGSIIDSVPIESIIGGETSNEKIPTYWGTLVKSLAHSGDEYYSFEKCSREASFPQFLELLDNMPAEDFCKKLLEFCEELEKSKLTETNKTNAAALREHLLDGNDSGIFAYSSDAHRDELLSALRRISLGEIAVLPRAAVSDVACAFATCCFIRLCEIDRNRNVKLNEIEKIKGAIFTLHSQYPMFINATLTEAVAEIIMIIDSYEMALSMLTPMPTSSVSKTELTATEKLMQFYKKPLLEKNTPKENADQLRSVLTHVTLKFKNIGQELARLQNYLNGNEREHYVELLRLVQSFVTLRIGYDEYISNSSALERSTKLLRTYSEKLLLSDESVIYAHKLKSAIGPDPIVAYATTFMCEPSVDKTRRFESVSGFSTGNRKSVRLPEAIVFEMKNVDAGLFNFGKVQLINSLAMRKVRLSFLLKKILDTGVVFGRQLANISFTKPENYKLRCAWFDRVFYPRITGIFSDVDESILNSIISLFIGGIFFYSKEEEMRIRARYISRQFTDEILETAIFEILTDLEYNLTLDEESRVNPGDILARYLAESQIEQCISLVMLTEKLCLDTGVCEWFVDYVCSILGCRKEDRTMDAREMSVSFLSEHAFSKSFRDPTPKNMTPHGRRSGSESTEMISREKIENILNVMLSCSQDFASTTAFSAALRETSYQIDIAQKNVTREYSKLEQIEMCLSSIKNPAHPCPEDIDFPKLNFDVRREELQKMQDKRLPISPLSREVASILIACDRTDGDKRALFPCNLDFSFGTTVYMFEFIEISYHSDEIEKLGLADNDVAGKIVRWLLTVWAPLYAKGEVDPSYNYPFDIDVISYLFDLHFSRQHGTASSKAAALLNSLLCHMFNVGILTDEHVFGFSKLLPHMVPEHLRCSKLSWKAQLARFSQNTSAQLISEYNKKYSLIGKNQLRLKYIFKSGSALTVAEKIQNDPILLKKYCDGIAMYCIPTDGRMCQKKKRFSFLISAEEMYQAEPMTPMSTSMIRERDLFSPQSPSKIESINATVMHIPNLLRDAITPKIAAVLGSVENFQKFNPTENPLTDPANASEVMAICYSKIASASVEESKITANVISSTNVGANLEIRSKIFSGDAHSYYFTFGIPNSNEYSVFSAQEIDFLFKAAARYTEVPCSSDIGDLATHWLATHLNPSAELVEKLQRDIYRCNRLPTSACIENFFIVGKLAYLALMTVLGYNGFLSDDFGPLDESWPVYVPSLSFDVLVEAIYAAEIDVDDASEDLSAEITDFCLSLLSHYGSRFFGAFPNEAYVPAKTSHAKMYAVIEPIIFNHVLAVEMNACMRAYALKLTAATSHVFQAMCVFFCSAPNDEEFNSFVGEFCISGIKDGRRWKISQYDAATIMFLVDGKRAKKYFAPQEEPLTSVILKAAHMSKDESPQRTLDDYLESLKSSQDLEAKIDQLTVGDLRKLTEIIMYHSTPRSSKETPKIFATLLELSEYCHYTFPAEHGEYTFSTKKDVYGVAKKILELCRYTKIKFETPFTGIEQTVKSPYHRIASALLKFAGDRIFGKQELYPPANMIKNVADSIDSVQKFSDFMEILIIAVSHLLEHIVADDATRLKISSSIVWKFDSNDVGVAFLKAQILETGRNYNSQGVAEYLLGASLDEYFQLEASAGPSDLSNTVVDECLTEGNFRKLATSMLQSKARQLLSSLKQTDFSAPKVLELRAKTVLAIDKHFVAEVEDADVAAARSFFSKVVELMYGIEHVPTLLADPHVIRFMETFSKRFPTIQRNLKIDLVVEHIYRRHISSGEDIWPVAWIPLDSDTIARFAMFAGFALKNRQIIENEKPVHLEMDCAATVDDGTCYMNYTYKFGKDGIYVTSWQSDSILDDPQTFKFMTYFGAKRANVSPLRSCGDLLSRGPSPTIDSEKSFSQARSPLIHPTVALSVDDLTMPNVNFTPATNVGATPLCSSRKLKYPF